MAELNLLPICAGLGFMGGGRYFGRSAFAAGQRLLQRSAVHRRVSVDAQQVQDGRRKVDVAGWRFNHSAPTQGRAAGQTNVA